MAEDFLAAAVKRIEEQFAGSGVEECFETFEEKEDQITMRDGVKLHTIYYFPKMQKKANRESVNGEPVNGKSVKERPGNEKPEKEELESERLMNEQHSYPVILTRTCYPGNDRLHRAYGEGLARRGYVYVYQYCRGRETSEGKWEPNINERNDGIDTMNYLVEQPWCENLGYWGHSYTALTGWAFADAAEGKVAAMFLEDYGTDRFVSAYEKGCFRHDILTSWSMGNAEKPVDADYRKSCRYLPQIGSRLQPETDYREDVKSFVSAPLEKPLRLNGKASVKLFVSTDCEDTAFTAKIMEVTPEGSRVRVDISSSDFPQYHVHSNQKGLWSEQTENKIAHQTIHMGGVYPSCVILPEKK